VTQAPVRTAITDAQGNVSTPWRDFFRQAASDMSTVGEYVAVVGGLDLGEGWRMCDGTSVKQADYPALYQLIGKTSIVASSGDEFSLPLITPVASTTNPGGQPVLQWWVRAR
jgi:hypothetical protein